MTTNTIINPTNTTNKFKQLVNPDYNEVIYNILIDGDYVNRQFIMEKCGTDIGEALESTLHTLLDDNFTPSEIEFITGMKKVDIYSDAITEDDYGQLFDEYKRPLISVDLGYYIVGNIIGIYESGVIKNEVTIQLI